MTDPTELIAHATEIASRRASRRSEDEVDDALMTCVDMIRTLAAERDAALPPKCTAPKGKRVRARIAVWLGPNGVEEILLPQHMRDGEIPDAWITADIPLPQPVEIVGTVEATPASSSPEP